jgi:preprotein translocase subunit YajC
MTPENLQKMKKLILRASDEELNELWEYMQLRHNALRRKANIEAMEVLQEGDHIKLTNIKPKYLVGLTGTISKRRQTKFEVLLDQEVYRAGRKTKFLVVPAQCLRLA